VAASSPPEPDPAPDPALEGRLEDVALDEGHRLRDGAIWLVVLAALVVALLLAVPGLQGVANRIADVSPGWIVLAVVLEVASCVGYVLAFELVFYRAPRLLAARIAFAEMAFGTVLPAGGAGGIAIGAWIARAKGGSLRRFMERSAVLYLLTSAINLATLSVAGFLGAVGILPIPHPLALGLVPGVVGAGGILAFLGIPRFVRRFAPGDPRRGVRWLRTTAEVVQSTANELRHPRWRLVGALAYLWADIAVLWVAFRAFGGGPPLGALVLAYQIGYLADMLPVPGGIGVLDGGIAGALILYGIAPGPAAAAVLVYHAIVLWIPTLLGTISFLRLRRTLHEPVQLRPERTA
jgi:uncharacterized membrane protein YbhN (UPF0104 family)